MSFVSDLCGHFDVYCVMLLVVYLNRVHRDGNKVVLVHVVELPELSLNKARMCSCCTISLL